MLKILQARLQHYVNRELPDTQPGLDKASSLGINKCPCTSVGKESACNVGDLGSIPGLGRSPGERNGNPLQYSSLGNPMDRGAWQATVHGVSRVGHNLATKLTS